MSAADPPPAGSRANLAEFGQTSDFSPSPAAQSWFSSTVVWDDSRDIHEIQFQADSVTSLRVEYWVHTWPPKEGRGGWTTTDSPFRGDWKTAEISSQSEKRLHTIRFLPLTLQENENLKERPGYAPSFRRTLKVRVSVQAQQKPGALAFYGLSTWQHREVQVRTGLEGKPSASFRYSIYNGRILNLSPDGRIQLAYLEHAPGSADRTVLQLESKSWAFGIAMDDLILHREMYIRDLGVFVIDSQVLTGFEHFLSSEYLRPGQDIYSRIKNDQSMERARGEIPTLAHTGNNGRHPARYVPLGFPGNREKLALEYNGNIFISKHGSKAFEDELPGLRWEGDKIRFRFGAGAEADFRERPASATQRPTKSGFLTQWQDGPIAYEQETFAAPFASPLNPWSNRGDERAAAFLTLRLHNNSGAKAVGQTWLQISPTESLKLDGQWLRSTAGFRAWAQPSAGEMSIQPLPKASQYPGNAMLWRVALPPGASANLEIRLPFRTPLTLEEAKPLALANRESIRSGLNVYWEDSLRLGMRIHTPDPLLNRFYDGVLQHILTSVYRDLSTGLFMAPCATYDYNMFLNETNLQVRMLDMRGLHDLAARFLEPALSLQGSKPLPGMFRSSDGVFHGVRIDEKHDYTNSGYNLNHGWTMWTLAEHYWFSRDLKWLRANAGRIRKAAQWIIEERSANQLSSDTGLLPPGQLEDNEEWQHWFAVNAYAYKGLKSAAEVLAELDPVEGTRLRQQASAFRQDIRSAVRKAMAISPVVQRGDKTWIPYIPSRTGLHGTDHGWIRNILYGAHSLIDGDVIDPKETWATWILQDLEDNRFMAPDSFAVAEQEWFSRGGIALQPNLVNTPLTYLARNDIPHALRAFYNSFAASYFEDINAFAEWVPSFGRPGGPYFKTSDEAAFLVWLRMLLLSEDGDRLDLNRGAPRLWLRHGQVIDVQDAATFFGPLSYRVESHIADGRVSASVDIPAGFRAREIRLVLRHPENKIPRTANVGSRALLIDRQSESVSIPVQPGKIQIEITYE